MNQLNIPNSDKPRVVVIGCGFAGLNFTRKLPKDTFQIVMVDKHNYHNFQPLLYQVATSALEPDSIAQPIRGLFDKRRDFYYRMAEAEKIVPEKSVLQTNIGEISYDYLVIATGSETNYFGMDSVEKNAVPMKSVPEALNLRSIVLQNFEAASISPDRAEQDRLMNFVVVGGGPTGVELSGALAEMKSTVLPSDYPELDFDLMSIYLLEMQDRVLPPMSETASQKAQKYLEKIGVKVLLETSVKNYDGKTVETDKENIQAATLIWAAGVKGTIIQGLIEGEDFEKGRYLVNEFNQIGNHQNLFAIGDVAAMISDENPKGHPMLAQVAIQQGKHLAKNLDRWQGKKLPEAFDYNDKGTMATIGRNKAVADIGKAHFGGFIGWLLWMGVHLFSLVGFRNRVVVFTNWVVSYFSYGKQMRLIIRPVKKVEEQEEKLALDENKEAVESEN